MSAPKKICVRNSNSIAENWRQVTEKMSTDEKNQYMLEHGILTDCTFVVGPEECETKEFKAHRFLLCNASAVFERMLTGEMVEAKTGRVRVTDLSPNTFQLLLSSIYGKYPEMMTFQEAQEFAYGANKYQMKLLLIEHSVMRMCALLEPENIWTAFETADLLQNERLKKMCHRALRLDTLRCITDPWFMQASEENVALLLEQDELNVDDELTLVIIAVHWARREAQRRGLTGDDVGVRAVLEPRLLSLFRFLAMSLQHFMLGPGLAGWLTSDEKDNISECLRLKDLSKNYKKMLPHLCAVTKKRKHVSNLAVLNKNPSCMMICIREVIGAATNTCQPGNKCCKRSGEQFAHYNSCYHAMLTFQVNYNCQWLGFQRANRCRTDTIRPSRRNQICYQEKIIVNMYKFNFLPTKRIQIGDGSCEQDFEYNTTSSVKFDEPIPLVTNNCFALELKFQNDGSPLGHYLNPERARRVRTEAGVDFFFHTGKEDDSYNEGLIEALIFSL